MTPLTMQHKHKHSNYYYYYIYNKKIPNKFDFYVTSDKSSVAIANDQK